MEEVFKHMFASQLPKPEQVDKRIAKKLFNFADIAEGMRVKHLNAGPSEDPILWLDNLSSGLSGPEFFQYYNRMKETKSCRYKLLHFREGELVKVALDDVPALNIFVQPMPDSGYLVASARSTKDHLNAFLVDSKGAVVNRFAIDDAIESLQAAANGNIWVGYFDEGAYANVAFACFDRHGQRLYPNDNCDTCGDCCVGLNVESDNCVWLLPNNAPLSKLEDFHITRTFEKRPNSLSGIFAIADNTACWAPMISLYATINFFTLSDLDSGTWKYFQPVDESGNVLPHQLYAGRGSKMYFTSGHDVYVFEVAEMQL